MSVKEFKRQIAEHPPVPGGTMMPMFHGFSIGVVSSEFAAFLAEVVERLEALEAASDERGAA